MEAIKKEMPALWNHPKYEGRLTVTVPEAAEIVGCSGKTMYNLIHSEGFPVLWIGRKAVISIEGLIHWVRKQSGQEGGYHG